MQSTDSMHVCLKDTSYLWYILLDYFTTRPSFKNLNMGRLLTPTLTEHTCRLGSDFCMILQHKCLVTLVVEEPGSALGFGF